MPRDIGIAEQRQNRMIKRRRGDFDLPGVLRAAIFGQNARQQLELFLAQSFLVGFGVVAAFLRELRHDGIRG